MTEREHTNGDDLTLAVVVRHLEQLQNELRRVGDELAVLREEGRQARAVISQGQGLHHDQTYFYLGQFVGAFNLLGGKLNAISQLIIGRGITEVVPEGLVRGAAR